MAVHGKFVKQINTIELFTITYHVQYILNILSYFLLT